MTNVRRRRRATRDAQAAEAFRASVARWAFEMEEPLRHAAHLCRAIQMAERPADEEVEALAFVASEAHARLMAVSAALRGLFVDIRIGRGGAAEKVL